MNDLLWGTNLSWPGLQYAEEKREQRNFSKLPWGERGGEDVVRYILVVATVLHILGKSAKSGMQNIGRGLFSM